MGELLKKPYEISVWEDRLVTEEGISYYKEIKLAVIGTNLMDSPNRVHNPILVENVNGEKTLTFSLAYRYFDELVGNIVVNPFHKYLINERKVKLYYNDEWFEFLIKECNETSEDYVFTYTARELFSHELSKVGYNVTLDQSLNNNQGTVVELGKKVLEDTDWQVDEDNSDLLQQYVQEPLYKCTVTNNFKALDLSSNEQVDIETDEVIYVFYSYINNKLAENVQFIREADRNDFIIDDNSVIRSTNYRFIDDVSYSIDDGSGATSGINNVVTVDSLFFDNQGYRLVYGYRTLYDPVMDRTVTLYQAVYDDGLQDIYHYEDYTYTTSDVVVSYLTNGSNFNIFEDGQLQGWYNTTPTSATGGKKILQPMKLVTRPEIASGVALDYIQDFGNISGYLQLKFAGILNSAYENTYFNTGFNDTASIIDHITAGEKFALRLRYFTGDTATQEKLVAGAPNTSNGGVRAVVAKYTTVDEKYYLDDKATTASTIKTYKIDTNGIVLDFDGEFKPSYNVISGGTFNASHSQYLIDGVVQTPSDLYRYHTEDEDIEYVWDKEQLAYTPITSDYADYYMTTAQARSSFSNEELHDPKFKLGIFLYIADSKLVNKYIFIEDIQLTHYYEDSEHNPITIGNVPTAVSTKNDYFYLKPVEGASANEITTYGTLDALAAELGINTKAIDVVYNENCEKILSIQASASNCFNILQDLCETFECWLHIEVPHEADGSITLDENFNPIKKVAFKEYAGKDNFSGFRNGINLTGIERNIDSEEIVTKLIVDPVQSDYTGTGSVDIQGARSNPSGESTIINLSYYLNRGLITDVEACNKDLLTYYDTLHEINEQISELNAENVQMQTALTRLSANRDVYTALIDEAVKKYNKSLEEFYEVTSMDYDEYVSFYHNLTAREQAEEESGKASTTSDEERQKKDLINNETVVDIIGSIYASSITIKNYTGLLINVNEEYKQLDLQCNGAKTYAVSVTSTSGAASINPSTQVTFEDYVSGVEFRLLTSNGSYVIYQTGPNDRIFTVSDTDTYEFILFSQIPENYRLQYFENNKAITLDRDNAIGASFKIRDQVSDEVYSRRFKLIPNDDYAAGHVSLKDQVDQLIEQKKIVQKEFYKKYSRFLQEGTWSSQDYIDSELYYLDALQVSNTSAQPKVSYTINVLEVSQLENLENYDFRVGDKTYIEDTEFFGYLRQSVNYDSSTDTVDEGQTVFDNTIHNESNVQEGPLIVFTPVREEVIVSEIEWHLDTPEENTITIQNYKTRFEDLFQRISATVQAVQRNEITYPKTTSILDESGLINSTLLSDSISGLGALGFALTSNGSVVTTGDGLIIRDLTNSANLMRLMSRGLEVSTDGGQTWNTAVSADGISTELLTANTINTQKIWLMDGDNPSFRWDKAGLSAYGLDAEGRETYDLKTFVRFDKYGLYGIKNNESYVATSLADIRDKAYFGVTWEGFFIKNSYTDGSVSITSDDDFLVEQNNKKRIHIGAVEKDSSGAPSKYGIKIYNDNEEAVFDTGDDGNLKITGTINALAGNFSGRVSVGNSLGTHILIDGSTDNPTIRSSNYQDGAGLGWIINAEGDATFSNVSVRGAIKTAVFEYEEIQAVGGAFLFRPSSTIKTARVEDPAPDPSDEDTDEHDGADESNIPTGNLIVSVEKPLMFRVGNWVKISNYNSMGTDPAKDLTTYGLVHIYKIIDIAVPGDEYDGDEDADTESDDEVPYPAYEITLEGGAAILDAVALEDLPGGALIDFGNELGTQNYGIGINSSDNYVNLPARAISLFETTIHPDKTTKVTYNYRGILGTLPQLSASEVNHSIYNNQMAGTQGIYTDNMYIGDNKQFIAFYTDKNGNKQLRIQANEIIYEVVDEDTGESEWKDITDITQGADGQDAVVVRIDSSAGDKFMNKNISSILTCTVIQGTKDITDRVTKFTWKKKDKDGNIDESWSRLAAGNTITIGPADIDSKAIFICEVEF